MLHWALKVVLHTGRELKSAFLHCDLITKVSFKRLYALHTWKVLKNALTNFIEVTSSIELTKDFLLFTSGLPSKLDENPNCNCWNKFVFWHIHKVNSFSLLCERRNKCFVWSNSKSMAFNWLMILQSLPMNY